MWAIGLAILIVGGSWLGLWYWLQGPPCVRRRVVLNLVALQDEALVGVLWSVRGPWLTLKDAAIVKSDGSQRKLDGEQVVHRDQIVWTQVVN